MPAECLYLMAHCWPGEGVSRFHLSLRIADRRRPHSDDLVVDWA